MEHTVEHAGDLKHFFLPRTPDAPSKRAELAAVGRARVEGCYAAAAHQLAVAASPGGVAAGGGAAAGETPPIAAPLVHCASHKATAVATELEALDVAREATLEQLQANREAVKIAIDDRYNAMVEQLETETAAKRAALTAALAASDAALEEARLSTGALIEVGTEWWAFVVIGSQ